MNLGALDLMAYLVAWVSVVIKDLKVPMAPWVLVAVQATLDLLEPLERLVTLDLWAQQALQDMTACQVSLGLLE